MLDQLAKAIKSGNLKEITKWGVQVQIWRDEMVRKLEKQETWLETQRPARSIDFVGTEDDRPYPTRYVDRFEEWMKNLDEYKRACRLLDEARGML